MDTNLIKQAYELGYRAGLEKEAAKVPAFAAKALGRLVNRVRVGRILRNATVSSGLSKPELNKQIQELSRYLESKGFDPAFATGINMPNGFHGNRFGAYKLTPSLGSGGFNFVPFKPKSKVGKSSLLLQSRFSERERRKALSHIYMPDAQRKALSEGSAAVKSVPFNFESLYRSLVGQA